MPKCKIEPYSHQSSGTELLIDNLCFALFDDMGTGKTKTIIDAACQLKSEKKIDAAIVVCPNSLKNNWGNSDYGQIALHGWDSLDHTLYIIRSGLKFMPLKEFKDADMIWVMVNYESVWRDKTETWLTAFMQRFKTALILDESQRIKNSTSSQSKGCIRLAPYAERRYIMTGTPVTKHPLDFWAQFRFLDESITGHRIFQTFRLKYAKLVDQIVPNRSKQKLTKWGKPQPKTHTIQVVDGYKNMDDLLARVGPYYRRVEKKDCLDLPEKVYMRREVELNKEQQAAYKAMSDKLVIELGAVRQDEMLPPVRIKAPIALTKMLRLLQITSGYVTQDGDCHILGKSPKLTEMVEVMEEHNGQLVVFFREHPERIMLQEALTSKGISFAAIHGGVKELIRTDIQQDFQRTSKYKVILANVSIGGIGLDLTAADLVLYNSNSHSLEHRWQSEDRVMRIGQGKKCTYMDFLACLPGPIMTLDHQVLRALETKVDLADLVVKNVENLAAFFQGRM